MSVTYNYKLQISNWARRFLIAGEKAFRKWDAYGNDVAEPEVNAEVKVEVVNNSVAP